MVIIYGILSIVLGILLGLTIYKFDSKLTWKQVFSIKYRVMIILPLIDLINKLIIFQKKIVGKLYKFKNYLETYFFKIF